MKQAALVLAVLAFASPVHAGISKAGPTVSRTGSGWVMQYPDTGGSPIAASARTITAVGTTSATVRDLIPLQAPGGSLAVTATRSVTAASVALGALELAGKAAAPIAVGMALYDLYKGSGIRQGPDGALQVDPGTEPTDVQETEYWIHPAPRASNQSSACENYRTWVESTDGSMIYDPLYGYKRAVYQGKLVADAFTGTNKCQISTINPHNGAMISKKFRYESIASQTVTKRRCGTGETRVDGLCVTDIWLDAKQVPEQKQLSNLENAIKNLGIADILTKIINAGQVIQSTPPVLTGPASQTGTPTSVTTTTPTETKVVTTTPTYNYTYNGDTITYITNEQTVTNITADGKTTTETTTTVKPPDKGMCDLYPDSLACMKPGDPPTDPAPTPKTFPISIEPMAFPGQGACPPPITFAVFGTPHAFEWTPFCDVLTNGVRPIVLVLSIAAAAMIFVGGLKS